MPKTFAFSNKGNYWKTRYSFLPCQYSTINKYMYSYPVNVFSGASNTDDQCVAWLHQYGAQRCRWYNIPSTSAVALTFNDLVSNNKMYRTLSIEGTNNVTPLALLAVNNSRSANQVKEVQSVNFREKGGIMYSGLTGSSLRSNKSITTLGTILNVTPLSYSQTGVLTLSIELDWVRGAKGKIYQDNNRTTGLYTVDFSDAGQITRFLFPSGIGSPVSIANWQAGDDQIFRIPTGTTQAWIGNELLCRLDFSEAQDAGYILNIPPDLDIAMLYLNTLAGSEWSQDPEALGQGITLVAITPDEVNGAKPQGQYADLIVSLGTNDYEVYAFNAYYEPNTLDHSK